MMFRRPPPQTNRVMKWGTLLLMLFALAIAWRPLSELLRMAGDQEAIIAYLDKAGLAAPIILFLLLFIQVFLAPIPGHALMIAGGYVYGFWPSTFLTAASTTLATQVAFMLTRRYGLPLAKRFASEAAINRWKLVAGNRGAAFFFFAMVLPIFPSDLMCYIAGLGKISHRDFLLANFLARSFIAAILCSVGSHGLQRPFVYALIIGTVYGVLFLTWKAIQGSFAPRPPKHGGSRGERDLRSQPRGTHNPGSGMQDSCDPVDLNA